MEVCLDTFFINLAGSMICTFKLQNRTSVDAVYGNTPFRKECIYTPGTGVDAAHANYGFYVIYDPPLNDPSVPPGVSIEGNFEGEPDLSGALTDTRTAIYSGTVIMDRDTYPGENDPRFVKKVEVTLGFNPGID